MTLVPNDERRAVVTLTTVERRHEGSFMTNEATRTRPWVSLAKCRIAEARATQSPVSDHECGYFRPDGSTPKGEANRKLYRYYRVISANHQIPLITLSSTCEPGVTPFRVGICQPMARGVPPPDRVLNILRPRQRHRTRAAISSTSPTCGERWTGPWPSCHGYECRDAQRREETRPVSTQRRPLLKTR